MAKYVLRWEKIDWLEPEDVFRKIFAREKNKFWLDGNFNKSYSYMGTASKSIKLSNKKLRVCDGDKYRVVKKDILEFLEDELRGKGQMDRELSFGFKGGYVGYFEYEGTQAAFLFAEKFFVFDHAQRCCYLVCLSEEKLSAQRWFAEMNVSLKNSAQMDPKRASKKKRSIVFDSDKERYINSILKCKEYLAAGEAYQICLTYKFSTKIKLDRLELFFKLRQLNPAPYSAFIDFGDTAIISSSPELFLKTDDQGNVFSKPMKGTSARGKTVDEDEGLRNKLGKSEKDFAENAMIVDLVRNDLGRVCETGSVEVADPLSVETYETVHQLVSTVRGKLKKGKTIIDAIRAAFPGGSMTGAPKIRVMEILAGLEKEPRRIYSGCFGYIGLNGAANLAMTIRTIVAEEDILTFGSGGAILIDSKPEDEYEEMLLKAKAMIEAIAKTAGVDSYRID